MHRTHEASITKVFGTEDWKQQFFEPSQQGNLFDVEPKMEKAVTSESAALFMIERMKTIFRGGVSEVLFPLGKHGYPSFHLLFAWSNPSKAASALASKLSNAAYNVTDRKYGRIIRD